MGGWVGHWERPLEVGAGVELVGLGVLQTAGDLVRGLVEGGSPVLLLGAVR